MIVVQCYSCQKSFQIEKEGDFLCPHCGVSNHFDFLEKSFSPWELSYKVHPFSGFVATLRALLFSPVIFFKSLKVSSRYLPVVLFGVTTQTVGLTMVCAYQLIFSLMGVAFLGLAIQTARLEELIGGLMGPVVLLLVLVFVPFFSFVGIVFSTALNHFVLWILRGAKNGLEATLHAVCYAQGAQIALVVPFAGGIVAGIWQVVLLIIGLKELHGISYGKSILAIFLPLIFCGVLVIFAIGLLAAIFVPAFIGR